MAWELNNHLRRWLDRSPQRFSKLLAVQPEWSLMDFGCGPGFYTIPFARVASRVVGVDVEPEMLKRAEAYAQSTGVNVEFAQSDGTRIPFPDESFDMIFLSFVYHEIENKSVALAEFRRLLTPAGQLAIREKTVKTLNPFFIGPPIIPIGEIQSKLKESGFSKVSEVGGRGKTIVIGAK